MFRFTVLWFGAVSLFSIYCLVLCKVWPLYSSLLAVIGQSDMAISHTGTYIVSCCLPVWYGYFSHRYLHYWLLFASLIWLFLPQAPPLLVVVCQSDMVIFPSGTSIVSSYLPVWYGYATIVSSTSWRQTKPMVKPLWSILQWEINEFCTIYRFVRNKVIIWNIIDMLSTYVVSIPYLVRLTLKWPEIMYLLNVFFKLYLIPSIDLFYWTFWPVVMTSLLLYSHFIYDLIHFGTTRTHIVYKVCAVDICFAL